MQQALNQPNSLDHNEVAHYGGDGRNDVNDSYVGDNDADNDYIDISSSFYSVSLFHIIAAYHSSIFPLNSHHIFNAANNSTENCKFPTKSSQCGVAVCLSLPFASIWHI